MTLAALRVRSFRFQWPADLLTSWAFEMETLALGWYVMVETGSVLWLTAFGSLQFFGTLAAPMFGVLGDRVGGRLMLCAMRATYAGLAAVLLALAVAGLLTPVRVFVVASIAGLVRPNDLVMRNTLIGETIPAEHLLGAVGMSRATMDCARVVGALTGAGLSAWLGLAATYVAVTAVYGASLALTFGVSRRPAGPDPGALARGASIPAPSRWRDLEDGVRHIAATPQLLAVIWLAFLINLTAYPLTSGLLPYVAQRIYRVDAAGLGWLVAAFALGALLGSVGMVATGGPRRPPRAALLSTAVWYTVLLGFAHAPSVAAGLALLLVAGFVQSIVMISLTATLLAFSGGPFRSRVMGVRTLAVYGLPVGLMTAGWLIDRLGFPATLSILIAVGLLFTAAIGLRWRASLGRPLPAAARV